MIDIMNKRLLLVLFVLFSCILLSGCSLSDLTLSDNKKVRDNKISEAESKRDTQLQQTTDSWSTSDKIAHPITYYMSRHAATAQYNTTVKAAKDTYTGEVANTVNNWKYIIIVIIIIILIIVLIIIFNKNKKQKVVVTPRPVTQQSSTDQKDVKQSLVSRSANSDITSNVENIVEDSNDTISKVKCAEVNKENTNEESK